MSALLLYCTCSFSNTTFGSHNLLKRATVNNANRAVSCKFCSNLLCDDTNSYQQAALWPYFDGR
jgi:hypothetical protein